MTGLYVVLGCGLWAAAAQAATAHNPHPVPQIILSFRIPLLSRDEESSHHCKKIMVRLHCQKLTIYLKRI